MQGESRTDKWLRTGLVVFLAILLLLIIFNGTAKTSDVSNWIIAFANIAMAAAAVKAWLAARKFLSEFFAQEGFRLAIEMINQNVIHLGINNTFLNRFDRAVITCSQLNGERHTDLSYETFNDAVVQAKADLDNHRKWRNNIESLGFRMETYGIYAAENKIVALTDMTVALDSMLRAADKLYPLLKKIWVSINCESIPDKTYMLNFGGRTFPKCVVLWMTSIFIGIRWSRAGEPFFLRGNMPESSL